MGIAPSSFEQRTTAKKKSQYILKEGPDRKRLGITTLKNEGQFCCHSAEEAKG